MPSKHHIGKAGHLAVMSELANRGYNVAIPEIDIGDDIFAVNDASGAMWRVQVKTANAKPQKKCDRFQFRIKVASITKPLNPDLHFVFVMRHQERWRFAILDRAVLKNYMNRNSLGAPNNEHLQLSMTLDRAGKQLKATKTTDLSLHLEDWSTWPRL